MNIMLYVLTIVAGLLNPVQSGCNATLNKTLHAPAAVVLISLGVSLLCALIATTVSGGFAALAGMRLGAVPWWAWIGGVCGFIFLLAQPIVAAKLGAAVFIGITVTASTVGSVVLDNYGLFGFQQHAASLARIAGAALMIAGVALVSLF